ncbi:MAG: DUF86 domain-containing protein [Polyangiaceae bacterium]
MTQADVADKAAFVRAALEGLESLPQDSLESFLADPRNLPSALHWMQTAIQALVDIGLIVVSARGLPTPRSSSEVLERLEEAGALPPDSSLRFRPIVGFRNRVVHLYDRIDPEIVYRVLVEDRGDLVELLDLLLATVASLDPASDD